jgi:hypothetical protein
MMSVTAMSQQTDANASAEGWEIWVVSFEYLVHLLSEALDLIELHESGTWDERNRGIRSSQSVNPITAICVQRNNFHTSQLFASVVPTHTPFPQDRSMFFREFDC